MFYIALKYQLILALILLVSNTQAKTKTDFSVISDINYQSMNSLIKHNLEPMIKVFKKNKDVKKNIINIGLPLSLNNQFLTIGISVGHKLNQVIDFKFHFNNIFSSFTKAKRQKEFFKSSVVKLYQLEEGFSIGLKSTIHYKMNHLYFHSKHMANYYSFNLANQKDHVFIHYLNFISPVNSWIYENQTDLMYKINRIKFGLYYNSAYNLSYLTQKVSPQITDKVNQAFHRIGPHFNFLIYRSKDKNRVKDNRLPSARYWYISLMALWSLPTEVFYTKNQHDPNIPYVMFSLKTFIKYLDYEDQTKKKRHKPFNIHKKHRDRKYGAKRHK
jgi:hypothetical protein